MKQGLIQKLKNEGHEVTDVGINSAEPDDKILDYADMVAHSVSTGAADRGILLCLSGGIMCIRANRWPGIRAVLTDSPKGMIHDREASDANIMCIGTYYNTQYLMEFIMDRFLKTEFEPLERRLKRLEALDRPCTLPPTESSQS
jgi:RpiB/LacA/LacB family sugar-phosphate isomerase